MGSVNASPKGEGRSIARAVRVVPSLEVAAIDPLAGIEHNQQQRPIFLKQESLNV